MVLKEHRGKKVLAVGGQKADLVERLIGRQQSKVKERKNSTEKAFLSRYEKSRVHMMPLQTTPLNKFKEYLNILYLAADDLRKFVGRIWAELITCIRGENAIRGYSFWDTYNPACDLLKKMVEIARQMV